MVPLLVLRIKSPVPDVVKVKSVFRSPATILSVPITSCPVPLGVMLILPLLLVELNVLPSSLRLSTSSCVSPAMAVVVLPFVNVLVPSVISFVLTAPVDTVKLLVLKLATPKSVVVATSTLIVILLDVGSLAVLITPSPSKSNVSVKRSIAVLVPLSALMFRVVTGLAQVALPEPSAVKT